MLKFYWNGIKDEGGKLQRCHFSDGRLNNHPEGTLTIYSREYRHFTSGIQDAFRVENDSDCQTDYFEKDRIRVLPDHPLHAQVKAMCKAQDEHYAKTQAKREAKRNA